MNCKVYDSHKTVTQTNFSLLYAKFAEKVILDFNDVISPIKCSYKMVFQAVALLYVNIWLYYM